MAEWIRLAASGQGKRKSNDDAVAHRVFRTEGRTVSALIACDGVGSRANSGACAKTTAQAALAVVSRYLRRRHRPHCGLDEKDAARLASKLMALSLTGTTPEMATTLVLVLFDHKRDRGRYRMLSIWAGDSRAMVLDTNGVLYPLTIDHHDEEGRLTAYVAGDGLIHGTLGSRCTVASSPPAILCVTTDGVHERCEAQDLAHFLLYSLAEQVRSDEQLLRELEAFLVDNISDNFSMALLYRRFLDPHKLQQMAATIVGEADHANSHA